MGFGRDGPEKDLDMDDDDDDEGPTPLVGAERGIGRIDEEEDDDDGSSPLDSSQSSYHTWYMRWLETDEDAD